MKHRYILLIAFIILAFSPVLAQKSMQGFGVNIGIRFAPSDIMDNFNIYKEIYPNIDIKYQYNISNYYRIEPFMSVGGLDDLNEFHAGINNHLFFCGIKRFRPYGLAGIGFSYEKGENEYYGGWDYLYGHPIEERCLIKSYGFYVRAGLGANYRFSHKWSGQIELSWAAHLEEFSYSYFQFKIGVAYNF